MPHGNPDVLGDGYGEYCYDPPPEFPNLNTYQILDASGKLLTTVQGNDPRSVLGIMMLVWGEGIKVTQVNERGNE